MKIAPGILSAPLDVRKPATSRFSLSRNFQLSLAIALAAHQTAMAGSLTLAQGLSSPSSLAVDGGGRSISFSQVTQSPCSGEIDALPADGGTAVQLATNTALSDSGSCRGVGSLWFSNGDIVYSYGGYVNMNIDKERNPCGSHCVHLYSNLSGGSLLGTYGGKAYFSSGFDELNTVPVSSGAPTTVANGYFIRSSALDTPNANYPGVSPGLYFVDYNTSEIFKFDLTSSTVTPVMQGLAHEGVIASDSKNVYWSDGSSILEAAKGQSCSAPNCTVLYSGGVNRMVADESETDNPAGRVFFSDGANLWAQSKQGGPPLLIYSGATTTVLQTDGAQVYFADNGKLLSLPVNATSNVTPLNPATIETMLSSTLDNGFYWLDGGQGGAGAGSLQVVAEQASQVDSAQYSTTLNAQRQHACSCKSAVYAALARYILRAKGQFTAATGVKIDDFFQVANNSPTPCAKGDPSPGANWRGNAGTWVNPVENEASFSHPIPVQGQVLEALLAEGPVLIQDDIRNHWMLATNVATVSYGGGQEAGISAYDPLTGSKVLIGFSAQTNSYSVKLILDPLTNVWCEGQDDCPELLGDINGDAMKYSVRFHKVGVNFSGADLAIMWNFTPVNAVGVELR